MCTINGMTFRAPPCTCVGLNTCQFIFIVESDDEAEEREMLFCFHCQKHSPLLYYGCFEYLIYCKAFFIRLNAIPSQRPTIQFSVYSDDMCMRQSCMLCLVPQGFCLNSDDLFRKRHPSLTPSFLNLLFGQQDVTDVPSSKL